MLYVVRAIYTSDSMDEDKITMGILQNSFTWLVVLSFSSGMSATMTFKRNDNVNCARLLEAILMGDSYHSYHSECQGP